jgi:carbonic anhydrase
MQKPMLIAILLPVCLLPVSAQAAKWVSLGTKDQARIEVDTSSFHQVDEDRIRVWHREIYGTPKVPDSGAFSFTQLTMLTEFQCGRHTASPIQHNYSSGNGTDLKTESFDSREARPVTPDSSLETVFSYACQHRTKPVSVKKVAPPVTPAPVPEPPPEVVKAKSGKKGKEEAPVEPPHWSYSGNTGADKWGSLGKEYAACSVGQRQSPIDIRNTIRADLPPIQFAYKPVPLSIMDNGHSIRIDTPDAGGITVDDESYELQQFHFHKPSEFKVNGKAYDMSVHLVHQSKAGKLAVVAVLFETGKEQNLVRTLWTHLPLGQGKPVTRPEVRIDPSQLLPAKRNYFTFLGSLTTPPCTEGVTWLVLKTPVQISKEQLADFGSIYKNNVRPVQPVNMRVIKESR